MIESVSGEKFTTHVKKMFKTLGLSHTYLDQNESIIPNRAKFYQRDSKHKLQNVPVVDNSLKWAGGGFLSTVEDLAQFGNAMLYSFQFDGKNDGNNEEERKNEPEKEKNDKAVENVLYRPSPYSHLNNIR